MSGYGYPHQSDSRNIGDVLSSNFDLNDRLTGAAPGPYKSSGVNQPGWAPSRPNLPNTLSGADIDRLVNGMPIVWGSENPDELLVFPLQSDPAQSQPGPVQPQSLFSAAPSNPMSPSQSAGHTAYHAPSTMSQDGKPPVISQLWQSEPHSSGYGGAALNPDSRTAGGNAERVFYEDIFQHTPDRDQNTQSYGSSSDTAGGGLDQANHQSQSSTGYASDRTKTRAKPAYPRRLGRLPGGKNFGQTAFRPRDDAQKLPQKPFDAKVKSPQKVSQLAPSSYIIQTRNGYQRARYISTKSRYSPEYAPSKPVKSNGVKGPAPSQPASPKVVKHPQR